MMNANLDELTEEQMQRVRAVSGENEIIVARTREEQVALVGDVDIIFGSFSRSLFEAARTIEVGCRQEGAGIDNLLFSEFVESPIILTSAQGEGGEPPGRPYLGNCCWGCSVGVGRAVRERTWDNRMSIRRESWELGGAILGIVGLGGVGIEVARRAGGVRHGSDRRRPRAGGEAGFCAGDMGTLTASTTCLEQSDVVSVCCPLTQRTRGLFDREAFRHMKPGALLVNVTRGPIIDGDALLEALDQGLISGAGLDVTSPEPLPADSPLWDHPHVIITPHASGGSPLRLDRTIDLFCENLRRFSEGRELLSVIDKQKGY